MNKKISEQQSTRPKPATRSEPEPFCPFRFQAWRLGALGQVSPRLYLPACYILAVLLILYFVFVDTGLRSPQVRLRFYVLSGEASLYLDGNFYSNLQFAPDWSASTVWIPAGAHALRIEKAGMEAWTVEREFRANIWNNRWRPRLYSFEVRMKRIEQTKTGEPFHLWQEAWRAYLYRGLEAQKELAFDSSHPYPWVLSNGLRAALYSESSGGTAAAPYRSADLQRGLGATTSVYQWGDLLSAYSLSAQLSLPAVPTALSAEEETDQISFSENVELLGPRSLSILARTTVKRLQRLEPGAAALSLAWDRAHTESSGQSDQPPRAGQLSKLGQQLRQLARQNDRHRKETESPPGGIAARNTVALRLGDTLFMNIPGQDFALQQTEVSNLQFARFWFSPAGRKWREERDASLRSNHTGAYSDFAGLVLYKQDRQPGALPYGWPRGTDEAGIAASALLSEQPVRGITWEEARAYVRWLQHQLPVQTEQTEGSWQLALPSLAERQALVRTLNYLHQKPGAETLGLGASAFELSFNIPQGPPDFSVQPSGILGIKGLDGSLWEWLSSDYLPLDWTAPAALAEGTESSDLRYKVVAGGSWLNTLPLSEGSRDLWANEFLAQDNELPVVADYRTIGGQFAGLRSPYTGFRLVARRSGY